MRPWQPFFSTPASALVASALASLALMNPVLPEHFSVEEIMIMLLKRINFQQRVKFICV
jgi:hypothetical protein